MSTSASFQYCDGETVRSRAVQLEWQSDGSIRVVEGAESRSIPRGGFTVSDKIGSIPRFLRIAEGGVIELPSDAEHTGLTADDKNYPIARAVHWLESRSAVAAVALTLVVLIVGIGLWQGAPRLARRIAYAVPPSIEQRAGEAAYQGFAKTFMRTTLDGFAQRRVQRQLDRLVGTRPPHVIPKLVFRAMGSANAFALPGGIIVVADELVKMTTNDDEIAAVLAHELGHIERRHGLQSVLRNSTALVVVSALTGDLSTLSTFSATLPFLLLQYGYAREFETEADGYAVALLKEAKIDPESLARILSALEQARPKTGPDFSYLSTHPSTPDRIQAMRGVTSRVARKKALVGPLADKEEGAGLSARLDPAPTIHDQEKSDSAVDAQPRHISSPPPEYPMELRAKGITGEALVEFIVTENGDVAAATVVKATHPLFGEAAAKAVSGWKFHPGKVGGRAVNTRMQQPVTFSLDSEESAKE